MKQTICDECGGLSTPPHGAPGRFSLTEDWLFDWCDGPGSVSPRSRVVDLCSFDRLHDYIETRAAEKLRTS